MDLHAVYRTATGRRLAAAALALATIAAVHGAAPLDAAPRLARFAVGLRVMRIVDPSRVIRSAGGVTRPRTLVTSVWYPASGAASPRDVANAPPATSTGAFPLVVFGHGFAVRPSTYALLLHAWAAAGYVVAAPAFPIENADAPGGPNRGDLVNQPRDMSVVISRLRTAAADPGDPFHGLLTTDRVAVAGHSDGAMTALATAYGARVRDRRVVAALVFSGARMDGIGGFTFRPGTPALLAVQGTADRLNAPASTYGFFARAARPKFLLRLLGGGHLAPYVRPGRWLALIERTSIAFLDRYLALRPGAGVPMPSAAQAGALTARP